MDWRFILKLSFKWGSVLFVDSSHTLNVVVTCYKSFKIRATYYNKDFTVKCQLGNLIESIFDVDIIIA